MLGRTYWNAAISAADRWSGRALLDEYTSADDGYSWAAAGRLCGAMVAAHLSRRRHSLASDALVWQATAKIKLSKNERRRYAA